MSWIAPPAVPPWPARLLLRLLGRGRPPSTSARLWARSPRAFLSFLALFRALDRGRSPLDPALRALVMARVSQVNRCDFCVDLNGSRALERGVSRAQLEALPRHASSPLFGPRERAALAFADAVTATGVAVPPEVRAAVRAAFDDDAVVELCALVAFQDMSSKFNAALDVPAEGRCDLLPAAPREAAR